MDEGALGAFATSRKTKQVVYTIKNHDNFKQEASVWFVSLKVLEATFCVGVKTKLETCLYTGNP